VKDENLVKLSLGVALAGIAAIYAVTLFAVPATVKISDINEGYAGRHVTINATIAKISIRDGNIFLTLDDGTGSITAVMFERTARGTAAYDVKTGYNISVTGQINIYKDELEVIADSVK